MLALNKLCHQSFRLEHCLTWFILCSISTVFLKKGCEKKHQTSSSAVLVNKFIRQLSLNTYLYINVFITYMHAQKWIIFVQLWVFVPSHYNICNTILMSISVQSLMQHFHQITCLGISIVTNQLVRSHEISSITGPYLIITFFSLSITGSYLFVEILKCQQILQCHSTCITLLGILCCSGLLTQDDGPSFCLLQPQCSYLAHILEVSYQSIS